MEDDFAIAVEYRALTEDDFEQAVSVEALAFYNKPTPERVEQMRQFFPAEWTVGAFVDGRLVADTRTIPTARRMGGTSTGFGVVGPVACLAEYRRQGHVGRLLRLALERMREQGLALSGLFTPHDALYARFGWERAEGRKRYEFAPKDIRLRVKGSPGTLEAVAADDWRRLDAIYRAWSERRNGPIHRSEVWWRESVLKHWLPGTGERPPSDAFVWRSADGADEGYAVYFALPLPRTARYVPWEVNVRDLASLSADAYAGLWEHILTHDIATRIVTDVALEDPFPNLVEDPRKVEVMRAEGPMLRIVDVERALAMRPYAGTRPVSLNLRVVDSAAPWNDGVWRIEGAEGRMTAERTDAEADAELTAGALAPVFTGYMRPEVAAGVGLLKASHEGVVEEMGQAFAVTAPPYSNDNY